MKPILVNARGAGAAAVRSPLRRCGLPTPLLGSEISGAPWQTPRHWRSHCTGSHKLPQRTEPTHRRTHRLAVRHRGAASSASRHPTTVPPIQMTPQQADTRFSSVPPTRRCERARGEVLCIYSCTGRAKGPRGAGVVSAGRLASSSSRSCTISRSSCRFRSRCTRPPPSEHPLTTHPERRACAVPVDLGASE